ncbi:hypothetical protein [Methylobacterium brachiatum]|uniref:hypothetical protein n=1 Tax=Methylobacterium brachiatum TaxID=269660 RepID=UPI0008E7F06C|nr:hypothetical protein [Methylobacterium brachiatum]SFI85255.1 hypothetical protein SAMN02799642_02913 [Methylobacterium brachiatum]
MNVTVAVLGRSAFDQPFTELVTGTVLVADAAVALTPAIPPAAAAQELQLRITPEDNVKVAVGQWLDPASRPGASPLKDYEGNIIGTDPAPEPSTRGTYLAWAKTPRQIPFNAGNSIVLARPGVAAAV